MLADRDVSHIVSVHGKKSLNREWTRMDANQVRITEASRCFRDMTSVSVPDIESFEMNRRALTAAIRVDSRLFAVYTLVLVGSLHVAQDPLSNRYFSVAIVAPDFDARKTPITLPSAIATTGAPCQLARSDESSDTVQVVWFGVI